MQNAATISFISCCFMLDFISADTIFHYFLELHTTLPEKKIFVTNFPPHPLNDQNSLSVKKVFCWCSLLPKGLIFDYACHAPLPPLNLPHHTPFSAVLPIIAIDCFSCEKSQIFPLTSKILKFFIFPHHFHWDIF